MRVAVVGLGIMGRNHVRVLRALEEVSAVVGIDGDKVARDAMDRQYRVTCFPSVPPALEAGGFDAAVVATPATTHGSVAVPLLERGIPLLVEKPLGATVEEAEAIVAAAGRAGTLMTVGHVERFNPAVLALKDRLPVVGRVLVVGARRLGPYPSRIRDVGVRLDLLTHDVDIVRHLTGDRFTELAAMGGPVLGELEDYVHAMGTLAGGPLVTLEVSWLSPTKVREVTVVGERGTLVADTVLQELSFQETAPPAETWDALATFRGIGEGNVTRYAIQREEPLRAELRAFLAAVRGEQAVSVTAEDGLEAVRLAESVGPRAGVGIGLRTVSG